MDSVLISGWHPLVPCRFSRLKKSIKCQMSWLKHGIGVLMCPPRVAILSRMRYLSVREILEIPVEQLLLPKSNIKILRIQQLSLLWLTTSPAPHNFTFFGQKVRSRKSRMHSKDFCSPCSQFQKKKKSTHPRQLLCSP